MIGIAGLLAWEIHTSTFQSRLLSRYASRLTWDVHEGASPDPLRAPRGPYDVRHGYTRLARFLDLLQESGFDVAWQASPSAELASLAARGIPPPYREKDAPALHILDRGGRTLYGVSADRFHFREFVDVPPLVVHSLLYVENRQLLDAERPHLNPALDWDRLVLAGWRYAEDRLFGTGNLAGGSTLATQIQKFRHSPNGRTASVRDKLQQMAAASLRAYRDGADTRAARRRIIVDYLNSMPLGAAPGIGELTGLGDGLWAWFGTTLEQLVVDLALPEDGEDLSRKGRAYKQALALLLATRRPVLYLGADVAPLTRRLHFYLGELQREGVISARLAAAARDAQLGLRARAPRLPGVRYAERKAANTVRGELLELLDLRSLYDLDRLDLRVETTLDATAQAAVMATLEQLDDPGFLKANGFYGKRLLGAGDPDSVLYTFSLYESSPLGNRVLVHADSFDQPLDLNDGAKLELGSTAKLRTIANYLMVVSELYDRYRGVSRQELLSIEHNSVDPITYWAAGFARLHPQASRERTLRASLERRYSANPAAKFFTGGGLHTFENFNDTFEDDMTLRMAFRHSVNLVFIRLMRELVLYYTAELGYDERAIIENRNHPDRKALLTAAVDHESREHLWAAYKKYEGLDADAAVRKLCGKDAKRLRRFAIHFSSGTPQAPLDQLKREAVRLFPERTEAIESDMPRYHRAFAARRRKLNDEAWLLGRQPLEVWLVRDRRRNPGAGWTDLVERSATARRQSFDWLLARRSWKAQNLRLRRQLERLAFEEIHAAWQKLGYPFGSLVPSLATAIGSSADRPQALAELVGILQNDGLRVPLRRIEALHFGTGTPYETRFEAASGPTTRVMSRETAQVLRQQLQDVVENGTGRRVRGALRRADGTPIPIGGKTGSGDNRFKRFAADGSLISSRPINRTASFVFFIGDRYYGMVAAYVPGEGSEDYTFTSALALQTIKTLAPAIQRLVAGDVRRASATSASAHAAP